jgi:hypothetical protein
MREAFGHAGIPWDGCGHEDRGDGVLVLVPAELPKGLLAESVPSALVTALRAHKSTHSGQERIRLRMALHAGEVNYDEHGVTAASVNLAFRLLDCSPLKEALARSSGVLAVIASSWFFEEVVRHSAVAAEAVYRPVPVAVKETTTIGWICLPDQLYPSGQTMPERLSAGTETPGGQPAVTLRTLPRDTAAFTGRTRELDRLANAVSGTAPTQGVIGIHAVDGMAGIGKTAFAVHAAPQLAAGFPTGRSSFSCMRMLRDSGRSTRLMGSLPCYSPPASRRSGSRLASRHGRQCGAATWPAKRCCWCWMTQPAPVRSARCCPGRRAAWSWSPAAAS